MNVQYFPGLRCYDSNLLAIMQLEKIDYLQLFSESFSFDIDNESAIPICDYNIRNQLVEAGALFKNAPLNVQNYMEGKNEYLQLEMDIFDIPWHPKYLKEHNNHYVLLTDVSKEHLIVRDPMCVKGEQHISLSEISRITSSESIDINSLSLSTTLKIPNIKINSLEKWADNVKKIDIFQLLLGVESDSYNNAFYKALWSVAHGISLYGQYFCSFVTGYPMSNFENLTKQWLILRSVIVNEYLRGTRNIDVVSKKIEQVLLEEKRLIGEIKGE